MPTIFFVFQKIFLNDLAILFRRVNVAYTFRKTYIYIGVISHLIASEIMTICETYDMSMFSSYS